MLIRVDHLKGFPTIINMDWVYMIEPYEDGTIMFYIGNSYRKETSMGAYMGSIAFKIKGNYNDSGMHLLNKILYAYEHGEKIFRIKADGTIKSKMCQDEPII